MGWKFLWSGCVKKINRKPSIKPNVVLPESPKKTLLKKLKNFKLKIKKIKIEIVKNTIISVLINEPCKKEKA